MSISDWFRRGRHAKAGANGRETAETLERIVQLTNPRLKFARRYRTRLTPAVETAMRYAHELVAGAPPACEASAASWQSDPCMRAFFATADDLARAFSRSAELRAWFEANGACSEVCAVLSMSLVERRVLGVALEGGVLRRDVPQTTVSVTDYRVRICGPSEPELRRDLECRIVDQLALASLSTTTQDRAQRGVLEQEN